MTDPTTTSLMPRVRFARLRRLIDRRQADLPHQTPHALAADAPAPRDRCRAI
jgi:hypothetical protein